MSVTDLGRIFYICSIICVPSFEVIAQELGQVPESKSTKEYGSGLNGADERYLQQLDRSSLLDYEESDTRVVSGGQPTAGNYDYSIGDWENIGWEEVDLVEMLDNPPTSDGFVGLGYPGQIDSENEIDDFLKEPEFPNELNVLEDFTITPDFPEDIQLEQNSQYPDFVPSVEDNLVGNPDFPIQ